MRHFYKTFVLFAVLLLTVKFSHAQKATSAAFPESMDPSYGYTVGNPILIKNGKYSKSHRAIIDFLTGLRTEDGQDFVVVERYQYAPSSVECYVLMSSVTGRKINIFIDPSRKGRLKLPIGLIYQAPANDDDDDE